MYIYIYNGCLVHFGRLPFYSFGIAFALLCLLFPICRFSQRGVSRIMFFVSRATLRLSLRALAVTVTAGLANDIRSEFRDSYYKDLTFYLLLGICRSTFTQQNNS